RRDGEADDRDPARAHDGHGARYRPDHQGREAEEGAGIDPGRHRPRVIAVPRRPARGHLPSEREGVPRRAHVWKLSVYLKKALTAHRFREILTPVSSGIACAGLS